MPLPVITFVASLGGIAVLFLIKYFELRRQKLFAPHVRYRLDRGALRLKTLLIYSRRQLGKLWPLSILLARYFLHEGALGLAALARTGEKQAHRLADLVSYKRTFERREPRSEFLKQVTDHKIENEMEIQAATPNRKKRKV